MSSKHRPKKEKTSWKTKHRLLFAMYVLQALGEEQDREDEHGERELGKAREERNRILKIV